MRISSSFDQLVNQSTQQAIINGAVNAGAESVTLSLANENTDNQPIYDVYNQDDNYLFSIDTDGDVIFER